MVGSEPQDLDALHGLSKRADRECDDGSLSPDRLLQPRANTILALETGSSSTLQ
jgi:hypothetical protein